MLIPRVAEREQVLKVTYIMPVFNGAKYLRASLQSTLRTLGQRDELIVVDDASTDNSLEILLSLGDPRLRVLPKPKNSGVADSLNLGMSQASNAFVARIDADDICLPWRGMVQSRLQNKENADFVFSSALLLYQKYRLIVPQKFSPIPSHKVAEALRKSNPFVHSTMFARKLAIEKLGGYRNLAAEDYDLWTRAQAAGFKIVKGNIPTVIHRIHSSQLTKSPTWIMRNQNETLEQS